MVNPLGKLLNKQMDMFGNLMKKTSVAFQFQSALASYLLIWFSIIFMFGYQVYIIITHFSWWNVFYAINALCGIFIIYSMLVSTFMSYLQIKAMQEINTAIPERIGEENV